MAHSLDRKVALITGAAHGIGEQTARDLVSKGASVGLLDRDEAGVKGLADSLGSSAIAVTADVTDRDSLSAAVQQIVDHYGGLDVVVANAGISGPTDPLATVDPVAFEQVMQINLLGACRTMQLTLPHILDRNGYLIAVSSMAAAVPSPLMSGYGIAKAGVDALGRALRVELGPTDADVGVAYFGLVETGLIRDSQNAPALPDLMAAFPGPMGKAIPARRAAAAITRGIERRSSHVYAPGWVRGLLGFRGQLTVLDRFFHHVPSISSALKGVRR